MSRLNPPESKQGDSNKSKFSFKEFDIYIRINDSENINFLKDVERSKESRKLKNRVLDSYYEMFNNKKHIIKEIKENLI